MIGLRKPPASRLLQEAFEKAIDLESYKPELIHAVPATFIVMRVEGVGYVVRNGKTGKIEYVERDWDHAERAIQWAVDNLPPQGGKIALLEGNFTLSSTINITKCVTLEGAGAWATRLVASADIDVISIKYGLYGVTIRDLRVSGVGKGISTKSGIVVLGWRALIERCFIEHCKHGVYFHNSEGMVYDCWIEKCEISNNSYGVYANRSPEGFWVRGNYFYVNAERDIELVGGMSTVTISDNIFGGGGVKVCIHVGGGIADVRIIGNDIIDFEESGIVIAGERRRLIANNIIRARRNVGGQLIQLYHTRELVIANNIFGMPGEKATAAIRPLGGWPDVWNMIVAGNQAYDTVLVSSDFNLINCVIKNNTNHPTDSFKAVSRSVEIGTSDSYGSPTEVTSPSGVISHFAMVLHITAGAGEIITAKVELLWEDGSTTSVEKQLDNSGGTAAASQDFEVPASKAEEISLWLDKNSLRKIRVYAKTDQTSPTADASVTFDIAGAG